MQLLYLDPRSLDADPQGVREDPGEIEGLAATIADQGLLQPLGVTDAGRGRYRVVYGNRRRLAALKLGLERVPCILLDRDDPQTLVRQLTENLQRRDLNDLEKSLAFKRLRDDLAATSTRDEGTLDEATAVIVGLAARTVRRYLGLLDLPLEVQQLIRSGDLTVTQAQHLRRIANERTQIELARAAVDEGMSAAELSRLSSYFAANPNLSLDDALSALQQGINPGLPASASAPMLGGGPLAKGGAVSLPGMNQNDDDLWDDEEDAEPTEDPLGVMDETLENQPKNKARVFRIRSLDQMLDETDRLARAHAEGDLVKWIEKDTSAPMKVGLLLRQLETLTRTLRNVATQRGWEFEE